MSKGTKDNADDNQPDQSNIGNTKTQNISAKCKRRISFKQFLKSKILQLFQMSEAQEHKVFPKGKGDRIALKSKVD